MNVPHQPPHPAGNDDLDRAIANLGSDLERELAKTGDSVAGLRERLAAAPAAPPAIAPSRPPVAAAGGGRGREWGPINPRFDHPLAVLEAAAMSAYELHQQTGVLLSRLTGQQVPPMSPRPVSQTALLPSIVALASEIEAVLNEVRRLVEHMQGRL